MFILLSRGTLLEETPDTIICCEGGEKMMVKETLAEVTQRAIEYARMVRNPLRLD